MKNAAIILSILAAAAIFGGAESQTEPTEPQAGGGDALAATREANSDRYASPPDPVRPGHVTPRALDADAIRRQPGGFEVRLPSRASVTSPAVHRGKVFVSGGFRSREFYAFDARTGELAWGLDLDDDGPSTAACAAGICAFNTESCTIFTVEAETGKLLWAWWLGDPLMSAPAIAGGRVFTSYPVTGSPLSQNMQSMANVPPKTAEVPKTGDTKARPPGMSHALAAFDLQSGEVLWQRWIDSDAISAPVADGDELFVATFAGTVYRFDQATGRILSARRDRATSAPTVSADGVYFSKRTEAGGEAAEEGLAGSRRKSGAPVWLAERKVAPYLDREVQQQSSMWFDGLAADAANGFAAGAPAAANAGPALENVGQGSVSTLQAFQGSRVLNRGDWNFSTMGDEVICTSARDGQRRWSYRLAGDLKATGGFLAAPPAATDKGLLVATLQGEILLLDPEDGRKRRQWQLKATVRSQPVAEHGWIYVGTEDGRLVALDTGDRGITGWPMWGGNAARNG